MTKYRAMIISIIMVLVLSITYIKLDYSNLLENVVLAVIGAYIALAITYYIDTKIEKIDILKDLDRYSTYNYQIIRELRKDLENNRSDIVKVSEIVRKYRDKFDDMVNLLGKVGIRSKHSGFFYTVNKTNMHMNRIHKKLFEVTGRNDYELGCVSCWVSLSLYLNEFDKYIGFDDKFTIINMTEKLIEACKEWDSKNYTYHLYSWTMACVNSKGNLLKNIKARKNYEAIIKRFDWITNRVDSTESFFNNCSDIFNINEHRKKSHVQYTDIKTGYSNSYYTTNNSVDFRILKNLNKYDNDNNIHKTNINFRTLKDICSDLKYERSYMERILDGLNFMGAIMKGIDNHGDIVYSITDFGKYIIKKIELLKNPMDYVDYLDLQAKWMRVHKEI